MKRNTLYKSALTFGIAFLSFGCSKIADINVSPNNPSVDAATPQILFPSAVLSAAGRIGGELNILGGVWSQYWTQSNSSAQYRSIDSYNLIRTDLNANYSELFAGSLSDLQLAITQAKAANNNQYYLMCTVMKAVVYETLVDLYDQVPYTEAFKGIENIQPKFDDGYSIYKGLLAEIDAALATNYNGKLVGSAATADLVFGGDMDKWRQFANTLELRMYLRMINAKPAEAQAGYQKLVARKADYLTVNAGVTQYTDATDKRNPFYTYNVFALNSSTNLRASTTLVSYLKTNGDPRIVPYFTSATTTSINQGDFNATPAARPEYSTANTPNQDATDPVFFLTAAESYFLQAEADLRFNGGVNTAALYNEGVNAAFEQVGAVRGNLYPFPTAGTTEQKIEAIIVQKWASLPKTGHTLEGFFEQERTGYPRISPVYSTALAYVPGQWVYSATGVTTGKLFPKRLVFPDVERSRNNNTPAEVPITTPVWWGK
ncbi:SusD/RagB family nutrient-binding outer membrane lipoprotein [Mucilaginibacter sp. PAMB04274]|uniref:SusD/RagB family nutrient-binding outer membrane lipoprotein n=1 Tax=Mucilaginibacter sp. PAMB04274 TaxID=3138568 RepID=UPI0031F70380